MYSQSSGPMFIVRQADPKVLYLLQSFFGFGSVFLRGDNYWSYSVHKKKDLIVLAEFFNGKLFQQKRIIQFTNWIRAFNRHFGLSLTALEQPAEFSQSNRWLCGFRDRDGSFGLYLGTRSDNGNLRQRVRFYLDQAYAKRDLKQISNHIGGTISQKRSDSIHYHRLMVETYNSVATIIAYFNKFPPVTTTLAIRYTRYCTAYNQYKAKNWKDSLPMLYQIIEQNKTLKKNTVFLSTESFIDKICYLS